MAELKSRWICILLMTLSLTTAAETVPMPDTDEDAPEEVMPAGPEAATDTPAARTQIRSSRGCGEHGSFGDVRTETY